jgi:hypothetical protein
MRRVILAIAALSMPLATSVATIATAGTAGASAPVSCTKVSGPFHPFGAPLIFEGCSGGLGKGTAPAFLDLGAGTITWTGQDKGTTSLSETTFASPGQGACDVGFFEQIQTGTVTANTSKADILGTTWSIDFCIDGAGNITLLKHTTFVL